MAITQKQALIAFLESVPRVVLVPNPRSRKYVVYHDNEKGTNWYVGSKGALRFGKNIKDSIPVLEKRRQRYIEKGKELLGK